MYFRFDNRNNKYFINTAFNKFAGRNMHFATHCCTKTLTNYNLSTNSQSVMKFTQISFEGRRNLKVIRIRRPTSTSIQVIPGSDTYIRSLTKNPRYWNCLTTAYNISSYFGHSCTSYIRFSDVSFPIFKTMDNPNYVF